DGISQFVLPSQAYNSQNTQNEVQISDSQSFGTHISNDTRFQFEHDSTVSKALSLVIAPTITVSSAFTDGGASPGIADNLQRRYELQNYTYMQHGRHYLKWGGRLRVGQIDNSSTGGYNGTFLFNSLNAYKITLQGLAAGLTATQIRAQGGGASQFSLTAGTPGAAVSQTDVGLYVEDDWLVRPNLTLSYGGRIESQTNIND